jgi:hypothetical protein
VSGYQPKQLNINPPPMPTRPPPPPFREVKENRKPPPPEPRPCRLVESWVMWPSKRKEKNLTTEQKLAYAMATLEALKTLSTFPIHREIIDQALNKIKEN